mgnify:CR=1 FL=1
MKKLSCKICNCCLLTYNCCKAYLGTSPLEIINISRRISSHTSTVLCSCWSRTVHSSSAGPTPCPLSCCICRSSPGVQVNWRPDEDNLQYCLHIWYVHEEQTWTVNQCSIIQLHHLVSSLHHLAHSQELPFRQLGFIQLIQLLHMAAELSKSL